MKEFIIIRKIRQVLATSIIIYIFLLNLYEFRLKINISLFKREPMKSIYSFFNFSFYSFLNKIRKHFRVKQRSHKSIFSNMNEVLMDCLII
jgi:hypothetical protein